MAFEILDESAATLVQAPAPEMALDQRLEAATAPEAVEAVAAQARAEAEAAQPSHAGWDAARSFSATCYDSVVNDLQFFKGTLAVSTGAIAVPALLASPMGALGVGVIAGGTAVGSLLYHDGHNPVAGFFRAIGDYCDLHPGQVVKAAGVVGVLVPLAIGAYQGADSYSEFVKGIVASPFHLGEQRHAPRKCVEFALQHRDVDAYKVPLLTSELIKGGGEAIFHTGKSALLGVAAAVGTLAVTSLLSAAYAYATGDADLASLPATADAPGDGPFPVLEVEPAGVPPLVTLAGVMPEHFA